MNLLFYCIPLLLQTYCWICAYQNIISNNVTRFSNKQIHNLFSVLHNVGSVFFITCYFYTFWIEYIRVLLVWSQSYYLFDCFNYQGRSDQTLMIFHHIGGILAEFFLFSLFNHPQNQDAHSVLLGFLCAEISNYPLYYIYHLKHTKKTRDMNVHISPSLYVFEVVWFILLRSVCVGYLVFIRGINSIYLFYVAVCFYAVSVKWTVQIFKKIKF
jgi:hypothetical protein